MTYNTVDVTKSFCFVQYNTKQRNTTLQTIPKLIDNFNVFIVNARAVSAK